MYPHNQHPPAIGDRTISPFDDRLSIDLEQVDIALQSNPNRVESIWLRLAHRILSSRIPESEVVR